tara:strand:- start:35 stop:277 length:243 start_codon:yes stop_codon:yes gene_type:complete
MLDAFNLEGINLSPNLKKTIKLITHFKLIIFLLFSILQSMWNLKVIDEQRICINKMKKEYITKGDKSAQQKAVNFCNGGG